MIVDIVVRRLAPASNGCADLPKVGAESLKTNTMYDDRAPAAH